MALDGMVLVGDDAGIPASYTDVGADLGSVCAVERDMTTRSDQPGTRSVVTNGYAPPENNRASGSADPELPSFITEILVQYKDLLVKHVDTVKNKAVNEVKEEALLLHSQAELRLRSMESEMQQGVQAVLDRAREAIFEMVRTEMGEIFNEMESRLQALLGTGESLESDAEADNEHGGDGAELESLFDGRADESDDAESNNEVSHADVRLDLPPPLDPRQLLGFYRGLSATHDLRILRAVGSLDKGVNLYIRPKEPSAVKEILRTLPGVDEVAEGTELTSDDMGGDASADVTMNLKISLTAVAKD